MVTGIPGKVADTLELRRFSVDHHYVEAEEYVDQP